MPLRNPNDTDPANLVLSAMGLVLPGTPSANTVLGTYNPSGIFVNSWQALFPNGASGSSTTGIYPLLMLEEDRQFVNRVAIRTWQGNVTVLVHYIHRWDRNPARSDAIWQTIDTDLRRMKANLEDNPTLTVQVTSLGEASPKRHAQGIEHIELSTYRGQMNLLSYPFGLIARTMTVTLVLPPYVGAA